MQARKMDIVAFLVVEVDRLADRPSLPHNVYRRGLIGEQIRTKDLCSQVADRTFTSDSSF
jgi:hypothetical protein